MAKDTGVRLVDAEVKTGEEELDRTLRPKTFAEYIGQDDIKKSLAIAIEAAQGRGDALDHILLFGPPGLGKTTLAHIIAQVMGGKLKATSGSAIERPGDLAAILTNLDRGDILFIDEIHRLGKPAEEVLYSAMEDFFIDIIVGKGPSARSLRLDLPKFTLIGATTKAGNLSSPLRDRFGSSFRLDFYRESDIQQIISRSAKILGITISKDNASIIATASRCTPRIANRLLKRIRDYAAVHNNEVITPDIITAALELMKITPTGLDNTDRKILECIIQRFHGGPVGLSAISATIAEDQQTLEEVYEPYLLRTGFINRTAKGRTATKLAYEFLDLPLPDRLSSNFELPINS